MLNVYGKEKDRGPAGCCDGTGQVHYPDTPNRLHRKPRVFPVLALTGAVYPIWNDTRISAASVGILPVSCSDSTSGS